MTKKLTRADVEAIVKAAREKGEMPYLGGFDLSGLDLRGADLRGADLSGTNLWRAVLRGADMREVNLSKARLGKTNLEEADLRGADLSGVHLWRVDFSGTIWPDNFILGGKDKRGYVFYGIKKARLIIYAGCRRWASPTNALAHYGDCYLDVSSMGGDPDECIALINKITQQAKGE